MPPGATICGHRAQRDSVTSNLINPQQRRATDQPRQAPILHPADLRGRIQATGFATRKFSWTSVLADIACRNVRISPPIRMPVHYREPCCERLLPFRRKAIPFCNAQIPANATIRWVLQNRSFAQPSMPTVGASHSVSAPTRSQLSKRMKSFAGVLGRACVACMQARLSKPRRQGTNRGLILGVSRPKPAQARRPSRRAGSVCGQPDRAGPGILPRSTTHPGRGP